MKNYELLDLFKIAYRTWLKSFTSAPICSFAQLICSSGEPSCGFSGSLDLVKISEKNLSRKSSGYCSSTALNLADLVRGSSFCTWNCQDNRINTGCTVW